MGEHARRGEQAAPVGLLGDGGHAREVGGYLGHRVAFHAVSAQYVTDPASPAGVAHAPARIDVAHAPARIDVATTDARLLATPVHAAVGAPGLRRRLVGLWGGERYAEVRSPWAYLDDGAVVGPGALLAPQSAVTRGARLGAHVVVNVGASVSHDADVADYSTLSPGARVLGGCRVGAGVFLGAGAVVSHGVEVAEGVVLGAGAVAIRDLDVPSGTYVGVPARLVDRREDWLHAL